MTGPEVQQQARSQSTHQLVIFALGGEDYALPIAQIKEVIRYTKPRAVSSPDAWVTGVISLRGAIVPIGDLAARLGVDAACADDAKIVIIETTTGTAGIIVDAVEEVLTIQAEQIDTTTITDRELMSGIAKIDERLVVVLDAELLLSISDQH
jgi:purine-binding chemotaxis protein CheW